MHMATRALSIDDTRSSETSPEQRPNFVLISAALHFSPPSPPNENLLTTSPTGAARRGPIDTTIRNCPQPHIKLSRLPPSSPSRDGDSLIGRQKSGGSTQWQQGRRATLIMPITHTHTHRVAARAASVWSLGQSEEERERGKTRLDARRKMKPK